MSKYLLFSFLIIITTSTCVQKTPTKKTMTGKYNVHLELNEKTIDKQGIKDSITNALSKAKEELSKVNVDFDLQMDTSTAEGKMEFFAKSFAKTMANFGKDLGNLGIMMGEAAGDVALQAMELTENLISKIKMDVELKENGEIIPLSGENSTIQFTAKKWEVVDDKFIIKDEEYRKQHEFTITDHTDNGFVLVQDKYRLIFERLSSDKKQ